MLIYKSEKTSTLLDDYKSRNLKRKIEEIYKKYEIEFKTSKY